MFVCLWCDEISFFDLHVVDLNHHSSTKTHTGFGFIGGSVFSNVEASTMNNEARGTMRKEAGEMIATQPQHSVRVIANCFVYINHIALFC